VIAYFVNVKSFDYKKLIGYEDFLKTLQDQTWRVQKDFLKETESIKFNCILLDQPTDNELTFFSNHAMEF